MNQNIVKPAMMRYNVLVVLLWLCETCVVLGFTHSVFTDYFKQQPGQCKNPITVESGKSLNSKTISIVTETATCFLQPDPAAPFPLKGMVDFEQTDYCGYIGPLHVKVQISGFPVSEANAERGFHVHEFGDLSNGCTSAGGHYNPFSRNHGAPFDRDRHVGDFGNIPVGDDGTVSYTYSDRMASLFGRFTIFGRGVVVHAGTDDLGRGGTEDSKTTGNAGSRLACCVIGRKSPSQ